MKGIISLKGKELEIPIKVQFNGFAYPEERRYPGFSISAAINRHTFDIGGTDTLHSGRLMHSDTIYFQGAFRMEKI